jgi:hypothetical protein
MVPDSGRCLRFLRVKRIYTGFKMENRIKRLLKRVAIIEQLIDLRQQQLDLMKEELSEVIDELNKMLNLKSGNHGTGKRSRRVETRF